jgi:hypothetical protein
MVGTDRAVNFDKHPIFVQVTVRGTSQQIELARSLIEEKVQNE